MPRLRNRRLTLRIISAAMMIIPVAYAMSADTTQTPINDLVPPPSLEEKAAHDESRKWTMGAIIAAAVIALITAGIGSWLAYAVWQKDGAAQDLTLRRYEFAIASTKRDLIEQQRLATEAKQNLASLQKDAADSKAAQQRVEIELAKQTMALSEQQERAGKLEESNLVLRGQVATLERAATDSKIAQQRVEIELNIQKQLTANASAALLEVQKKLAPRSLTKEQHDEIATYLKKEETWTGRSGRSALVINCLGPTAEPCKFAEEIRAALDSGGWTTSEFNDVQLSGGSGEGIMIQSGNESEALTLYTTLLRGGIVAEMNIDTTRSKEVVVLIVGFKKP